MTLTTVNKIILEFFILSMVANFCHAGCEFFVIFADMNNLDEGEDWICTAPGVITDGGMLLFFFF